MAADTQKLASSQTPQLDQSDDQLLPSGDDVARQALGQINTEDEVASSDQIGETITSLQNVIERNANQLDELKEKLKESRESLRSVFENDTELTAAQEQVSNFSQSVKERKVKLLADATVVRLQTLIGELNEQKKELEETLSNHLVNYYDLTKSTSFDTQDGDQREFTIRAAVKSSRRKR